MYKVNTDREFFEKFNEYVERLKELSTPFQNPNTTMSEEEVDEWDRKMHDFRFEIEEFLREAGSRIV